MCPGDVSMLTGNGLQIIVAQISMPLLNIRQSSCMQSYQPFQGKQQVLEQSTCLLPRPSLTCTVHQSVHLMFLSMAAGYCSVS